MAVQAQRVVSIGQSRAGQSVGRVNLGGLIEILDALLQVLLSSLVPQIDSSQVSLMSVRIDGPGTRQASPLSRRQLDSDLAGDVVSNIFLLRKNVMQVALVALGPKVLFRIDADELCG